VSGANPWRRLANVDGQKVDQSEQRHAGAGSAGDAMERSSA
jgi:hypothetical protein